MIKHPPTRRRPGFTLVEMLVAVAVVSLMMVLFARVFTLASASVSTQKGIARNDQRARTVLNLMRSDLLNRSCRSVLPFAANETDAFPTGDHMRFDNRRGFFYVSDNDPDNPTDDVLQFTIAYTDPDADVREVFGLAANLGTTDRDEPEWDDGIGGNRTGRSQYAVVTYFLRAGTLYRRIMLIRQPQESATAAPSDPVPAGTIFWRHFDYHVHNDGTGMVWHGNTSIDNWLDNDFSTQSSAVASPRHRFGHNYANGRPREYDSAGNFIGRFTHEETSHDDFNWPLAATPRQPFATTGGGSTATINTSTGVVTEYAGGPRRGEDILMQNVHEFDVKIFDDGAGAFVDIGGAAAAHYGGASGSPHYGTNAPNAADRDNVFDTWHPMLDLNTDSTVDAPPFRPAPQGADGVWGSPGDDDLNGTPDDISEHGWPGSDDYIGLRAIEIRIRFHDPESGQMRQLTIRHGLSDRP